MNSAAQQHHASPDFHGCTVPAPTVEACKVVTSPFVGPVETEGRTGLTQADLLRAERFEFDDIEHEVHIFDLDRLWRIAYARFEAFQIPADRDEALMWLHMRDQAVLQRSKAAQMERHAAFVRELDDGVDYFQARGAADREALSR